MPTNEILSIVGIIVCTIGSPILIIFTHKQLKKWKTQRHDAFTLEHRLGINKYYIPLLTWLLIFVNFFIILLLILCVGLLVSYVI